MQYTMAKAEYTEYLKARGYSIEAIKKAFIAKSKPRREDNTTTRSHLNLSK